MTNNSTKKEPQPCFAPGCTKVGLIKVENDNWLCSEHIQERIHNPTNMALTQADEDLETFREEGGKPS
ncbi:hypothetical protein [Bradyrhizobium barranii]|uniref:hypothetical protein n=1 Tax=Bradyrhizobium TaxID=374 RepID=UPI0024B1021B|nr:hypothetical protein [Bradyrhizobium barranii]WFT95233.1 hypothetical protein QA633_44540 [Bradyrhizobium barranii]